MLRLTKQWVWWMRFSGASFVRWKVRLSFIFPTLIPYGSLLHAANHVSYDTQKSFSSCLNSPGVRERSGFLQNARKLNNDLKKVFGSFLFNAFLLLCGLSACLTLIWTAVMLKTTVWGTPNKLKLTFTINSKQRSTRACIPPPARWLRKAFSRAIFVNKISSFQIKWHCTLSQVFNKSWITGDPVMRADILLKQVPSSGLSVLNQKTL